MIARAISRSTSSRPTAQQLPCPGQVTCSGCWRCWLGLRQHQLHLELSDALERLLEDPLVLVVSHDEAISQRAQFITVQGGGLPAVPFKRGLGRETESRVQPARHDCTVVSSV